jgi:hypothetical protein
MSNYDLFALSIQFTFVIVIMSGVGVEESIVNAPLVSLHTKNTNNPKSEIRFKQHNRLFNAYFGDKFK